MPNVAGYPDRPSVMERLFEEFRRREAMHPSVRTNTPVEICLADYEAIHRYNMRDIPNPPTPIQVYGMTVVVGEHFPRY